MQGSFERLLSYGRANVPVKIRSCSNVVSRLGIRGDDDVVIPEERIGSPSAERCRELQSKDGVTCAI